MKISIQAFCNHSDTANQYARLALHNALAPEIRHDADYTITQADIAAIDLALTKVADGLESATKRFPQRQHESEEFRDQRRRYQEAGIYDAQQWIATIARLNNLNPPR